jgi:hypothetical protein
MIGHSMVKKNTLKKVYVKDPKPNQLHQALDTLYHNELDWTHVRAEAKKVLKS